MNHEYITWDIETAPLDDATLSILCPEPKLPAHPGTFDPASVKLGRMKDAEKIAALIEERRQAHAKAVAEHESAVATAREEHFAKFRAEAALDAATGRVQAIGWFYPPCGMKVIDCGTDDTSEAAGLMEWWRIVDDCVADRVPMIGFNIEFFDLPFLVRRSWIVGVQVPLGVRTGRYWGECFVDLMRVWGVGGHDRISLDMLGKAFGLDGKVTQVGDQAVSGADWWRLWRGTAEERAVAVEYLRRDLELPAKLAERMGVVAVAERRIEELRLPPMHVTREPAATAAETVEVF